MKNDRSQSSSSVDELIDAIHKKLLAHPEIVGKSLPYGRIIWRTKRNGEVEIDLELKI